jgi:hypothetical protein
MVIEKKTLDAKTVSKLSIIKLNVLKFVNVDHLLGNLKKVIGKR